MSKLCFGDEKNGLIHVDGMIRMFVDVSIRFLWTFW